MDIDIGSYPGDGRKPVVILIHGLGMNKTIWEKPSQSRILGGSLPIGLFVTKPPPQKNYGYSEKEPVSLLPGSTTGSHSRALRTVFHDLRTKDYPVNMEPEKAAGPSCRSSCGTVERRPFCKKAH